MNIKNSPPRHGTTFSAALAVCGMTTEDAALFFDVSPHAVDAWCSSQAAPPLPVWQMLADLFQRIEMAVDDLSPRIEPFEMLEGELNNVVGPTSVDRLPGDGDMIVGAKALLWAIHEAA